MLCIVVTTTGLRPQWVNGELRMPTTTSMVVGQWPNTSVGYETAMEMLEALRSGLITL